eukprot:scaffold10537_cov122-Isochrysis_galbana.AAC.21
MSWSAAGTGRTSIEVHEENVWNIRKHAGGSHLERSHRTRPCGWLWLWFFVARSWRVASMVDCQCPSMLMLIQCQLTINIRGQGWETLFFLTSLCSMAAPARGGCRGAGDGDGD